MLDDSGPRLDTTMSILTGKPGWINNFTEYDSSDTLFTLFERCKTTPMIFTTLPEAFITVTDPEIAHDHAYPIINTYTNETTHAKMVSTRNVWGRTDNFTMTDIWNNGWHFVHLRDWDTFYSV
jgi:hypothetical protein